MAISHFPFPVLLTKSAFSLFQSGSLKIFASDCSLISPTKFRRHSHWACVVGSDRRSMTAMRFFALDVDAASPWNEQGRHALPNRSELDSLATSGQYPVPPKHGPELACDQRDFGLVAVDLIGKRRQNVGRQAWPWTVAGLQDQSDTEVVACPKLRIDGRPDLLAVETTRKVDRNITAIDTERSKVEEVVR